MTTEQFKEIVLRHQPAMQRMAESLLGNEADAEDAVQESVVQLWQQRESLDRVLQIEAFCIALVKRRCIDALRKRHESFSLEGHLCDPPPDDTDDRYRRALSMVHRLPRLQQQAILMKYENLQSSEEIAQHLGISLSNLYTTLSRAYASLREMLNKENE